jgi:hypothetical protein
MDMSVKMVTVASKSDCNEFANPICFVPHIREYREFYEKESGAVLGCANMQIKDDDNSTQIHIDFMEAKGHGAGSTIVDFLKSLNNRVIITGESFKRTWEFWQKMGAIELCRTNNYGVLIEFKVESMSSKAISSNTMIFNCAT